MDYLNFTGSWGRNFMYSLIPSLLYLQKEILLYNTNLLNQGREIPTNSTNI